MTAGIQVEQILGHFLHRFPDLALVSAILRTQVARRWRRAIRANITGQPVGLMDGDINLVAVLVFNATEFAFQSFEGTLDQPNIPAKTIVHVNNPSPGCKSA